MTTPTGWDQDEDPAVDSPALGLIAVAISVLSVLCAFTYFFSPFAYLGALLALVLGLLARGVPASRGLGTGAVVLAATACVVATGVLVSVGG